MADFELGPDGRSTDLRPGGGVPDWMARTLNFCSNCGTALRFGAIEGEDRDRLSCPACGLDETVHIPLGPPVAGGYE